MPSPLACPPPAYRIAQPLASPRDDGDADLRVAPWSSAAVGAGSAHPLARLPLSVVRLGESHWIAGQRCDGERCEAPVIELVISGTMRLTQEGRESLIAAGEVLVRKAGARYACAAVGGPLYKRELVLGGMIAEPLISALPERVLPGDAAELRAGFDELQRLSEERPPDQHLRASTIAYRLVLQLSLAPRDGRAATPIHPTVAAAVRILETSGARDLDVRQVARAVGTSVSHLHRLFKEALGTSPLRHAREHLIRRAKDALGKTSLPCREIAFRLGYDDPLYFSAVFKRVVGVSPREFRRLAGCGLRPSPTSRLCRSPASPVTAAR